MKRTPLARKTSLRPGKPLQLGGPIQTRTRLERGGPIKRNAPLAPVGRKHRQRYEEQFNGWHSERLRRRPCDGLPDGSHAPGCRILPELNFLRGDGKNDPSHIYRRGNQGGLFFHIVTQSRECHEVFERLPLEHRLPMLPLAHELAWESHRMNPDLVPVPLVPENGEENP